MTRVVSLGVACLTVAWGQIPEVPGKAVDLATMRYIEIAEGTGAPAAPEQQYTVHYTGWLRDGTKFDSSRDRNEPFKFVQGRRQVIAGWEIGFLGMKAGGKRRLLIPYQLAYGEKGTGPIPPKAELIFDVELLAVDEAPSLLPAVDVMLPLSELEKKVLALANAVPEEKYVWRPGAGVRSFAEVFLHIAHGNRLLLGMATAPMSKEALEKRIKETLDGEKEAANKERILELLSESFAAVRKSLEGLRAGALTSNADFFGQATTRRGIFVSLDTHIAEHLGQAIAYARMNGIKPPWSQ